MEEYRPVLDAFFSQPNVLVKHQIESYNSFITDDIPRIVRQFSPYKFLVEKVEQGIENDPNKNVKYFRISINMGETFMQKPKYEETNGESYELFPNIARNKNLYYDSILSVKMDFTITTLDKNMNIISTHAIDIPEPEKIGHIPVMLKSKLCNLDGLSRFDLQRVEEDPYDYGGYFVIRGSEKFIIPQEKRNENVIFLFKNRGEVDNYDVVTEIKSVRDDQTLSRGANIKAKLEKNKNLIWVSINPGFANKDIPLAVLFKAIGITTDKQIAEYIVYDLSDTIMLELLRASLMYETKDPRTGISLKVRTQDDALQYIADRLVLPHQKFTNEDEKKKYTLGLLDRYLFPHIVDYETGVLTNKARYLGYMIHKLLEGKLERIRPDDRDDIGNKRIDLAGVLMSQIFRFAMTTFLDNMKKNINKELASKIFKTKEEYYGLIGRTKNIKHISGPFNNALSTGNWKTSNNMLSSSRVGVAQMLQRKSSMDTLSNLRRIFTPSMGGSSQIKVPEIRRLHPSHYGMICPVETPDGGQTGIVKNLAMTCYITIAVSPIPAIKFLEGLGSELIIPLRNCPPSEVWKLTPIFVNGIWHSCTQNPQTVHIALREARRQMQLDPTISIVRNFEHNEIRINTDAGRTIRPVYIVDQPGNKLRMNEKIMKKLTEENPLERWKWEDLIKNGIIEWVDVRESESNTVIANYPKDLLAADSNIKLYSHCEIHPMCMLGALIGLIPFSDHNQGPRNLFQGAMGKQAVNVYALNFRLRMDTQTNVLHYPQKPLITTYMMEPSRNDITPSGMNAVVAILIYTGYNQEDSIIANNSSLQRGLFISTNFKSFTETAKNEDKFTVPDPNNTKDYKNHANYSKLNKYGIIPPGTRVEKNDILIGKVTALDRSERNGLFEQKDTSVVMKEEGGIVDGTVTTYNGEGYEVYKIKIRNERIPTIGDKHCLTPDHEVLTFSGWVPIDQVTTDHLVYHLINDMEMGYSKPSAVLRFDVDEDVIEINSYSSASIKVTNNHRLWTRETKNEAYRHEFAKDVLDKSIWFDRRGYAEDFTNIYSRDMAPGIPFTFDAMLTFVRWIIDIDGYDYSQASPAFQAYFNSLGMNNRTKRFPGWVWPLPTREAEQMILQIVTSGTFLGSGKKQKYDISRTCGAAEFLDDLQRLSLHTPRYPLIIHAGGIVEICPESKVNCRNDAMLVHYQGPVHCITIDGGVFMVRRNGIPCWTGNSSRHGQKGVLSQTYSREDMPFTESGIIPDLIINPQAIPSRMTCGQLIELIGAKAGAMNGIISDGSPFTGISVEDIMDELEKLGFEKHGREKMYSGLTGEPMESLVFVGPTYYQRLKHIVIEKIHARATGPVQMLTRQPLEGRARDGGLRFGEMERDAMIAHGTVRFLSERFYEVSDKYEVFMCDTCGQIAIGNPEEGIYKCIPCGKNGLKGTNISRVKIPYTAKLLIHEIMSMGIMVRMFTDKYSMD